MSRAALLLLRAEHDEQQVEIAREHVARLRRLLARADGALLRGEIAAEADGLESVAAATADRAARTRRYLAGGA